MTYTIQREKLVPLWPELMPLLERHRAEVAPFPDWVLAPDYPSYAHAEESGKLWLWTVRMLAPGYLGCRHPVVPDRGVCPVCNPDWNTSMPPGPLAGYLIMFVGPSMHYTGTIMASQDVLFIAPEHRKGGLGVRLLRDSEADLRAAGVHCIAQRSKMQPGLDIGALFKHQGYRPVDEVWLKRIDKPEEPREKSDGNGSTTFRPGFILPNPDRFKRHADDPAFKKHCDTGGMLPLLPTIEAQQAALDVTAPFREEAVTNPYDDLFRGIVADETKPRRDSPTDYHPNDAKGD